jgi:hypothetical protein
MAADQPETVRTEHRRRAVGNRGPRELLTSRGGLSDTNTCEKLTGQVRCVAEQTWGYPQEALEDIFLY